MAPESTPQPAPQSTIIESTQVAGKVASTLAAPASAQVPVSSDASVFEGLSRALRDDEVVNPAVAKLLVHLVTRAERERDEYKGFVQKYHDADKLAATLDSQLKTSNAMEILYGTGLALGGAIIGLAPVFWDKSPAGPLALLIGGIMLIGSGAAKYLHSQR